MYTQTKPRPRSITLQAIEGRPKQFFAEKLVFLVAVIGAFLLTGQFVAKYLVFSRYPFEDAAMLMRYALNLAQTGAIVWNVGGKPVDGGTDFLFLVTLAGVVKAGLSVEIATRLLGIVAHLLTVVLVYMAIAWQQRGSRWLALLSATYVAIGPGIAYISAYFGTTFFALFACLTWYIANAVVKEDRVIGWSILFACSSLLMGLARPEGVILAVFMLVAVVSMKGIRKSREPIVIFLATFALLGGLYFLWRWHYFGYPLPNPFYKKGGGHIYLTSLNESIHTVVQLCGPFPLALLFGLRSRAMLKQAIFLLIPTAGFMLIWVLLSGEMNYVGRFQYAIMPILLMSWPILVKGIQQDCRLPRLHMFNRRGQLIVLAVLCILSLSTLWYQNSVDSQEIYFRDGKYDMAMMLRSYSQKHYTMATTEAGLLPLYSQWRDIDTWGLNDQWIAHNGQITAAYLDEYRPELIMFHAPFSPVVSIVNRGNNEPWFRTWFPMLMILKQYAESHGYILAASFGVSPYDTYYYYVRNDFADSSAIVQKIRDIPYYSYSTGEVCINYALLKAGGTR